MILSYSLVSRTRSFKRLRDDDGMKTMMVNYQSFIYSTTRLDFICLLCTISLASSTPINMFLREALSKAW